MKKTSCIGLLCWLVVMANAVVADEPPIALPELALQPTVTLLGCTLTPNWTNFPGPNAAGKLEPTYQGNPANWWEQIDGTFSIYVNWYQPGLDPTADPQQVNPPQPVTDFLSGAALTQLQASYEADAGDLYVQCAEGNMFEAPQPGSTPINADGTIHMRDIFGGTMEGTKLILKKVFTDPNFCVEQNCLVVVMLAWDHPDTYHDASTDTDIDAMPGTSVNIEQWFYDPYGDAEVKIWAPQLTVMMASADFAGTSERWIGGSDLSRLASYLNPYTAVTWGFNGGARNFEMNINPFGGSSNMINNGDLSVMAFHLGDCCDATPPCQLPKPGPEDERAAILRWFGIAPTGAVVVAGPNGETLPEFAIVDRDQNQRAIADPYGYRTQPAGTTATGEIPWGKVKRLYR